MPRGKTTVFIDNSNVFLGSRNAGWRIDAKKLHAYMERAGTIWQTFFFASATDPPRFQQTNFYRFIKNEMRYEVMMYGLAMKTIHCKKCGDTRRIPVEKGLDVGLATKMLSLANSRAYETAILVAADKDYLETARAVKQLGIRVEIIAWRGTISPEMESESSASAVYFDDIRAEIEMTSAPDAEAEALAATGE